MDDKERKMVDCTEVHMDFVSLTEAEKVKLAEMIAKQRCVIVERNPHPAEALRPCRGAYWHKGERHDVVGRFHGWGSDYEEFCDAGPGNFTVGIIEGEDGTVAMCRADTIVFLDRENGERR